MHARHIDAPDRRIPAPDVEASGLACGLSSGRPGERLDPSQVPRIFKAMARRAGLPAEIVDGLSGHSTRVGAAQDMIAAGIGLPAICAGGARQARRLLDAPPADTLKGLRDRAILAVLLYHGLTRQELCRLATGDLVRSGAGFQLRVTGSRARVLAVHPEAVERIEAWLEGAGHGRDAAGPLFRPMAGRSGAPPRAVRDWLGHESLATTAQYFRPAAPEGESPAVRVSYPKARRRSR